ncbi:SDR family NAD(P)-dependent oxidoreductase [Erythrobacter sp. YT30]|uniref:SDR family NAD(P)-dependent oxidoreductase n=1 Tax=Erythrobacter sp. YT30 TaxID=1735012 RepID=UPI00076DA76A|nr:SDR family NAD(P)-dependent oxidoreductase [Erythrobacter sp. YT30]KWV91840.1 short-chain dehydrogenase [Erythrobacter sp. YT30]
MSAFGKTSTTDEVLEGKDLTGTRVFVTGATSGLGKETVRAMAAKGAEIILAGRNQDTLDTAVQEITSSHPDAKLDTIVCDLSSLESVRACGAEARERFEAIDILINNAGVMATPKTHTKDGFENQFGTNHLGHFVLTRELMPLVEAGDDKRIVNLSSRGHHIAPVHLDDPNFENRDYEPFLSYGHSKTANVLFTVGLEQRFADKGIHAYAVHPGGINTNLGRHMDEKMQEGLMANIMASDPNFQWKTEAQGAATSCWAATADELEGKGGVYCEDCHVAEVDDESRNSGVRSYAIDPDTANRLWALSEVMTGTQFSS